MSDTVRARTAGVRARRQWLTPLQRRHRHGSPSVRVAPVAVPLTGSARVQVAAASPCGPDSSDPVAWPCSTRSPAGKPPAKPVAAQKVSRRQGFALASVRSPEPGAARPGHSTAEVVGHLASLAKPSRRQPRLAAGSLSGTLTAGQCFRWPAFATLPSGSCLTICQGRFGHDRRQTRQL